MSFIHPSVYKQIADKMGEAYIAVKNSIYNSTLGSVGEVSFNKMQESLTLVTEDSDESTYVAVATDPPGSISNDLGSFWFKLANNDLTEIQAQRIASGLFSGALRRLNTHVVKRSGVASIAAFYSAYAYSASFSSDFNLFDPNDSSSYFSEEFAELSDQINVTIDSQYVQS